jgi:hypothetical protein
MITIDFAPGHHGHFLEYVVNNYIFKISAPVDNLFQQSGAAHNININSVYQEKKIVSSGHYSSGDYRLPKNTVQVITIKHDPSLDFVLLVNIYHRCHPLAVTGLDLNIDVIRKLHSDAMFKTNATVLEYRNNWFAKLAERHVARAESTTATELPVFEFNYNSFFCLENFIEHLQKLADFLNMTFEYNWSFVELYQKFISLNQGYQKHLQAEKLIDDIINNRYTSIDQADWQIQAYINYKLSKLFKIYNGTLHDTECYPSNTQEIYQLILQFVQSYDSQF